MSEKDVEKPLQLKVCKLPQPNVTTASHVGGTLTTESNLPETQRQTNMAVHINVCMLLHYSVHLFMLGASGGKQRLKW